MIRGIPASPGIAIGTLLVLRQEPLEIKCRSGLDSALENRRFEEALEASKVQLRRLRLHAEKALGEEKAAIFDAHVMILEDPELLESTRDRIRSEGSCAEWVFQQVSAEYIAVFEAMENEYMRARAVDIRDVSERVLRHLVGRPAVDLAALASEIVLVAEDLTPSQTATLDRRNVLGFVTDVGGKTSHSAILARSLEIPAVVGTGSASTKLQSGQYVVLNGATGEIILDPDAGTVKKFRDEQDKLLAEKKELATLLNAPSVTLDGHRVRLEGNIGSPKDLELLRRNGAEGVGLFRTEFLFMDRDTLPTEEEQYEAYREIVGGMAPHPVIIRTLDIGGDKELPYLKLEKEQNPFLGYRAIRICLRAKTLFRTQLRALLRSSAHGNLGIMFPMISGVGELLEAKAFLGEVRRELESEGVVVSAKLRVGVMIEIPSAALVSDELAKHADFFSIGTNDLIQYTCAVDRMNQKISDLYDPNHPAVLKLIAMTIENGHKAGIPVGMCGEMAGSAEHIPLLIKMGLDEFSMSPSAILLARKQIRCLLS
ncbi:phosphoenolpyruvate--protein phosphotransferase [Bdellovibrionota bacterium FG-2]